MTKKKIAVNQGDYEVGYAKPPKEHQCRPGESGNPRGQPPHRSHLWTHICKFLEMSDTQLKKASQKKLSQAQQVALTLVEKAKAGAGCGSERLARYCIDRDLGKPSEHLHIDKEDDLSDEECQQIRDVLKSHAH